MLSSELAQSTPAFSLAIDAPDQNNYIHSFLRISKFNKVQEGAQKVDGNAPL
jgi:hypothetical protein